MKNEFAVSKVAPSDVVRVSSLVKDIIPELKIYSKEARDTFVSELSYENLKKEVRNKYSVFLAAKIGKEIVGFLIGHFYGSVLWLDWVAVKDTMRRRGIATEIIKNVEDRAMKVKAHKIWCDSRSNNTPSINLLRSRGFRRAAILKNHWFGQDFFIWEKHLLS
jgi:ribosomal protein S18 acetylase RimI-like enzyme